MLQRFVHLSVLSYVCVLIVAGLSSTLGDDKTFGRITTSVMTNECLSSTKGKTQYPSNNEQTVFHERSYDDSKFETFEKEIRKTSNVEKKILANSEKRDCQGLSKNLFSKISKARGVVKKRRVVRRIEFFNTKHVSPSIAGRRKIDSTNSLLVSDGNRGNRRFEIYKSNETLSSTTDNSNAYTSMRYDNDDKEINRYLSPKQKRDVRTIIDDRPKYIRRKKNKNDNGEILARDEKIIFKESNVKNVENSRNESMGESRPIIQNSTSQILWGLRDIDNMRATDTPWPLVPGPISCDLDFQLRPSFMAKLGEFDYVVSVQLQRNPDEPADHACTGVVYNPRFIVIAPHCLTDNYGLTVTSTDDLCTIDEMIDVDYIIEHENYDAETRINDIALIKLKSEIHKRSAKFPKDDEALGQHFYAVGFGELMWRSFPDKMSKLLQKVPVRRYPSALKEPPGILHITTSHMDLTGAFRGDFGGALINLRGELVGLKSKLVKKSTDYEVYTRVRAYLPWIQSMVTLHGSW